MNEATLLEQMAATPPAGNARVAVVESSVSSGFMAPLHAHEAHEVVRVLEGSLTLFAGADTVSLSAGATFAVAGGVPHTFRVESSRARAEFTTFAPSAGRYEDFLRAAGPVVCGPSGDPEWSRDEDAGAVAAVAAAAQVTVLGPPGLLPADAGISAHAA